jgi:APA family basic amino acid/polyamine antiporter
VVGAGIFVVPSLLARTLPSAAGILAVWLVSGVLTYFGALAYAELGAMFPETGGQYVFLRESYSPPVPFLCGWTLFMVVTPGGIASLLAGFTIYVGLLVPVTALSARAVAIGVLAVFTYINYCGLQLGVYVQRTLTVLKILGIVLLVGAAVLSSGPNNLHLSLSTEGLSWKQFGFALAASLIAYEGWNKVSFVNGEMRTPGRSVPLGLKLGVAGCTCLYLVLTAAYLRVLSVGALAASPHVGADVAARVMGRAGAVLFSLTILASIFGSLNGSMLAGPRLYYAQACDGLFPSWFARIHPRHKTPGVSVLLQGVWAAVLILVGSYATIAHYTIFCVWSFYLLVVMGLCLLRWRRPDHPRPYRMWGYPLTPALFAGITLWALVSNVLENPGVALLGLSVMAAGMPVYFLSKRFGKRVQPAVTG